MNRRRRRAPGPGRALRHGGLGVVGLLLLAVVACSAPGSGPGEPPSTSPSSPRPTYDPDAALRTRLADALRADHRPSADLVARPSTALDVLRTGWLPGWQVVDVTVRSLPHPRRFFVGLSEDGRAEPLTGQPQRFAAMVTDAGVRVRAGTAAVDVGATFLDTTRTLLRYSERVEDLSRVRWKTHLSPAERAIHDRVLTTYGPQVRAPRATPAGDGWTATFWMVDGSTLVRHDVTVGADGAVTDVPEVVARDLPVPVTV